MVREEVERSLHSLVIVRKAAPVATYTASAKPKAAKPKAKRAPKKQASAARPPRTSGVPGISDKVLEFFGNLPQGETARTNDVAAALQSKPNSVAVAINRLYSHGNLQKKGRGEYALAVAEPEAMPIPAS